MKDAPEQQCYFQPKVHISAKGYLTNIGGRAYSEMCNYVSASKKRKAGCTQEDIDEYARKNLYPQHKQYKEDYAREYFEKHGVGYYDYKPWDRTASIYQKNTLKTSDVFLTRTQTKIHTVTCSVVT